MTASQFSEALGGIHERYVSEAIGFRKKKRHWPKWMAAAACFAILFTLSWIFIYRQHFAVDGLWWLGFRNASFFSSDYFPIIPWIFVYFAGNIVGLWVTEKKLPPKFYSMRVPFLADVGRNTLIIYLLHQPVLYGLSMIINLI